MEAEMAKSSGTGKKELVSQQAKRLAQGGKGASAAGRILAEQRVAKTQGAKRGSSTQRGG
jgi:hypothetical protein